MAKLRYTGTAHVFREGDVVLRRNGEPQEVPDDRVDVLLSVDSFEVVDGPTEPTSTPDPSPVERDSDRKPASAQPTGPLRRGGLVPRRPSQPFGGT